MVYYHSHTPIAKTVLGFIYFFNSREAIAAIIGDIMVFTTRRGVLRFYRFLRLEEEY